jgi:HK97 gp10 family phage protein
MIQVQFKLDGDKKLAENLKKINRTAQGRALREAAKQGAEVIVQEAKRRAPVDTGTLRDSIRSKFVKRRSDSVTVEIGPGPKGYYGYFLEFGTSKMAARPFLRPAMDECNQRAAEETQHTMVEAVLEEVAKAGH